jgi:Mn2+/Fe2+ NRAMP family transporter
VPVCAVLVWLLLVKGDYKSVEKVFLAASVFYIAYIITGVLSGPSWREAMLATVKAPPTSVWHTPGYISMTIAVIGTTISPWMQFYLQSSVVEKGVSVKDYGASRLDVIIGSIFTDVVGWFIVVACAATLYAHGVGSLTVPADAAEAMKPLAKEYAYLLFAVGLFNASFFAASVLPLSTAYTVCEGLGFESGVDKSFREAPIFYWLYTLLIAGGAGVVLLPHIKPMKVVVETQVLSGVLLPVILVMMLLLINRKDLMGRFVNPRWMNAIAWATAAVVVVLSVALMFVG